jgi:uncharacterized Rmd1/YagE family protein
MSFEGPLVISDVLAKSVVLSHDEREMVEVVEVIAPFTKELADHGRTRRNKKDVEFLVDALLVSGRVAVAEKTQCFVGPSRSGALPTT